jgi:hypothetical protein
MNPVRFYLWHGPKAISYKCKFIIKTHFAIKNTQIVLFFGGQFPPFRRLIKPLKFTFAQSEIDAWGEFN